MYRVLAVALVTAPSTFVYPKADVLAAVQHIDPVYCARGVDLDPFGFLTHPGFVIAGKE